jgi:hypothetical protein
LLCISPSRSIAVRSMAVDCKARQSLLLGYLRPL